MSCSHDFYVLSQTDNCPEWVRQERYSYSDNCFSRIFSFFKRTK